MTSDDRVVDLPDTIDPQNIPNHVAIIMDGNGRWATERGLPRREGHRQGVETVRETVRNCNALRIKVLTLFAFSTENWQRPDWEVSYLMSLPEKYFESELPELIQKNVQVRMIGDRKKLPRRVLKVIDEGAAATKSNSGMILNFALNYGSRAEILLAVNHLVSEAAAGKAMRRVTEKKLSSYLYTAALPDPDLLIRTSGEQRISNFLLWQLAYSELYFTEVYWPDFDKTELLRAVTVYQRRKRRFGGV
ncbi:MAG: isoprenyl transferase [Firmicutes bacterium]|nr:isoprenyl transferase [Bacillota bacterium]